MKMDILDKVYKKRGSMASRRIGDNMVLVPIGKGVADLENIYTLNETGAFIWEMVDGMTKVGEIRDVIVKEYDITPAEAEQDLLEHLNQLETIGAIEEI
ncbi:MAG: PqqD family protein [Deltaproteobacteria bacterium]|nr:PqqD family protein [Deltaproteobacteria bacterium]